MATKGSTKGELRPAVDKNFMVMIVSLGTAEGLEGMCRVGCTKKKKGGLILSESTRSRISPTNPTSGLGRLHESMEPATRNGISVRTFRRNIEELSRQPCWHRFSLVSLCLCGQSLVHPPWSWASITGPVTHRRPSRAEHNRDHYDIETQSVDNRCHCDLCLGGPAPSFFFQIGVCRAGDASLWPGMVGWMGMLECV